MTAQARTTAPQLTVEQRYLISLVADGHTVVAIAHRIGVSKSAAQMRLSRAYRRLDAINAPHAVAIAIRAGLLPAPNPGAHHQ